MPDNVVEMRILVDTKTGQVNVKNLGQAMESASSEGKRAFRALSGYVDQANRHFKSISDRVFSLKGTLVGLAGGYTFKRLGEDFLETGLSADAMQRSLEAATGSTEAAEQAQQFLRFESERLGLVFQSQIADYRKIAAAARGTSLEGDKLREIYLSVAEASTVLQLRSDETSGALNAISQMISKGNVQAEELRGQLGERLPGAFQIAAKAMGTTTAGLSDMLDKGEVVAEDFLPRFAKALREQYAGQVESASQSARASLNRMSNTWFEFKKTVMESGVMEEVQKQVDRVNKEFKAWLKTNDSLIRQKIPEYIEKIKSAAKSIWEILTYDPAIIEYGLVGLVIGGKQGAALLGALGHMKTWVENLAKALGMASGDILDFKDIATANFKELEELVKKGEAEMAGRMAPLPYFRAKMPEIPKPEVPKPPPTEIPLKSTLKDEKAFAEEVKKAQEEAARSLAMPSPMEEYLLGGTAEAALTRMREERTQAELAAIGEVTAAYNEQLNLYIANREEMARLEEEHFAREHEVMESMREAWGLTWEEIRTGGVNVWDDIGSAASRMSVAAGNTLANIISGTQKAREATQAFLKSLLANAISTLIQIGVQNVILAGVQKMTLAGMTAATAASMTTITAAAAPAAMLASIASFGGAAAAGSAAFIAAMASMTGALGATVAGIGAMAGGAGSAMAAAPYASGGIVTRPTLALLGEDGDEAVVPLSPARSRERASVLRQAADVRGGAWEAFAALMGEAAPKTFAAAPYASGGIVTRPTLALLGEDGDEAVVPLSPARSRERASVLRQAADVRGGAWEAFAALMGEAAPRSFTAAPYAAGGIVTRPTLALLGEDGDEAVVPLAGGRALSRGRAEAPLPPGVVDVRVEMHFHGDVKLDADLDEIREKIGLAVDGAIREAYA